MRQQRGTTPDLLHDIVEQIESWDELPELVQERHLAGRDRNLVARWMAQGVSPVKAREILRTARRRRAHYAAIRRAVKALPAGVVEAYELDRWQELAWVTWDDGLLLTDAEAEAFVRLWVQVAEWGRPLWSSLNPPPVWVARLAKRADLHDWPDRDLRRLAHHQWPLNASRRALKRALRAWKHGLGLPFKIATRAGSMSLRGMLALAVAWETFPAGRAYAAFWEHANEILRMRAFKWPRVSVGSPWLWLRVLYPGMSQAEAREALEGMMSLIGSAYSVECEWVRDFSPRGYRQARPALPEGREGSAYAVLLALTFGRRTAEYLRRMAARGLDAHEAAQVIPSLRSSYMGREELKELGRWLLTHCSHMPVNDLRAVAAHWPSLWEDFGRRVHTVPPEKLLAIVNGGDTGYEPISLPFWAEVRKFPAQRPGAIAGEMRWLASLVVPHPFPLRREWVQGSLRGRFLPRYDARGLFLGEYTNSCQHPRGEGSSAAWHGQESPFGGFFVVEDRRGDIVAMSWAWWRPGKGLCFDNIEAKGLGGREEDVAAIYEMAARDLAAMGYGRVTVGKGFSDLNGGRRWPTVIPPLTPPAGVYTDAREQWLLAEGEAWRRPEANPYGVRVVWPEALDSWRLERVARACYPEGFAFVDREAPDLYLVLTHSGEHRDEVVGYAALEARERYINDVAVLSEHRGPGGLALLTGVMQVILGIAPDEEWSADTRVATSYRLLQILARAKKVVITASEPGHVEMDGEPMRRVRFRLALTPGFTRG